ncbi:hypothetical protein GCM10022199_01140 [Marihabitans asiaticum]|uniref:4-oxalocrotonate tautomerase n=1 Tax=Marihabitans asiaticum TaxID=415218 RepID=A0A560WG05_9MICO|nr:tautomerase family protein [Marihabitans asiaticum]TWD16607.1 4-oxalocrotonate tautomerase [Marihabitans asiaticum]
MPIIDVTLAEGREPEKIRAMISALTDAMVQTQVAPREAVRVIVREVPPTNFAAGDTTLAERAQQTPSS